MSYNDSIALFNFYRRYKWAHQDFAEFQTAMIDSVRNSLGALMGPALLTGGAITAGSGMHIDVAAYLAVGADGYLHVKNSATTALAVATAHASLPRKDLVVARALLVDDTTIARPTSPFDSVPLKELQQTQVVIIAGTPNASPAYPSITTNDVILGGFTVLAAASAPSSFDTSVTDIVQNNTNFQNTWYHGVGLEFFGDGSDGDLVVTTSSATSGPLTSGALTRDAYFNNLTISGSGAINTAGFRLFVKGVLDITAAGASAICRPKNSGGTGAATTGGTAGTVHATKTVGGSAFSATAGGAGGSPGAAATAVSASSFSNGGVGGVSGAGGDAVAALPYTGGAAGIASASQTSLSLRRLAYDLLFGANPLLGGQSGVGGAGGGQGGGSSQGGGGGGGGAGGGVVFVAARTIARSGSTHTGAISAIGGDGGNGGNATAAAGDDGGGGGGASGSGGGWIYFAYASLTGTSATGALDAAGGKGGNGGNGSGGGGATGGNGGHGGAGGRVTLINVGDGTVAETVGTAGLAGTAHSGATGGAGGAASTCTATL